MERDKIPAEQLEKILEFNRKRKEESEKAEAGEIVAGFVKLFSGTVMALIRPLMTDRIREALRKLGVEI